MLLSEHIANLQKILEVKGDQELYTWVSTTEDTMYLAKLKPLALAEIDGNEYQVPVEHRNNTGKVLAITSMTIDEYDEDEDALQDYNLVIEENKMGETSEKN